MAKKRILSSPLFAAPETILTDNKNVNAETENVAPAGEQNALRIILKQREANYSFGESVISKMTYPLPPFSAVIGALHTACGYKTYHPMDISVQGKFAAKGQEVYRSVVPMESLQNDRDILCYTEIPGILGNGYIVVAAADKQGADIAKGKDTTVYNENLYQKYISEKKTKSIDPRFMTINKAIRYYENIYELELVLHIRTDKTTVADIKNNINNFTALGRREDFVEIVACDEVLLKALTNDIDEIVAPTGYSGYLHPLFLEKNVLSATVDKDFSTRGTLFNLPKNYQIIKENKKSVGVGRREFTKKWAIWASGYAVDKNSSNNMQNLPPVLQNCLWLDVDGEQKYIVDFF